MTESQVTGSSEEPPVDAKKWPPEFTLERERILKLLTGDRFYTDASAALREAVLNAIDAIYRRRHRDPEAPGEIQVVFDSDHLTLTVADTGDGMGRQQITDLFTTVGASAAALDPGGKSVGEFGIGVISYFMAGDEFSIQTFDGQTVSIGLAFRKVRIPAHREHSFRFNVNTRSGDAEQRFRAT